MSDTFLGQRYPKSKCFQLYVELDLLLAGQTVLFGEEGRAEGRFVVVVEFLVGEASEDGGFADS